MTIRRLFPQAAALIAVLLVTGCKGTLDQNVSRLNAAATQLAGGGGGGQPADTPIAPTETPVPQPTGIPAGDHDLTTDPNALLVQAWGQVYGLPSGTAFSIKATQQQVADYVIKNLQVGGFQDTIRGGSMTIALGQLRLDMALQDTNGAFGSGTVTFQPTLDASGVLHLNPSGADFSGLVMPNNFTAALGDSVHSALTGAPNDNLSRVTLGALSLDNGTLIVQGKVK